jgi:hypothetical protein
MNFDWIDYGDGKPKPMLHTRLKWNGLMPKTDWFFVIDTGADSCVLPSLMSSQLGISETDLIEEECNTVAGKVKIKTVSRGRAHIKIDGRWFPAPSLQFGRCGLPVIGRDFLFNHFDLRMNGRTFWLDPG